MHDPRIWADWEDDAPIRQGDLIRRRDVGERNPSDWRLIVTADCDIVQGKTGRYTWVRVVQGAEYLDMYWAPDQLRRFVARQGRIAADMATAQLKRSSSGYDPLTAEGLMLWLAEATVEDICAGIAPGTSLDPKLTRLLMALQLASRAEPATKGVEQMRAVWAAAGRATSDVAGQMRDAFTGDRGFPDFFLLPEMPDTQDYAFVALLREVESVDAIDVFGSERAARLADRPEAFHRFGRLHDSLRFAVAQKLAFLFSRIGLPSTYERACESAADLLTDQCCISEFQ